MSQIVTPNKQAALRVLAAGGDVEEAAEAARVTSRTIYRWMRQEAFSEELERSRRIVIDRISSKLAAAALDAVDVLHRIISEPASASILPAYVRSGAAKAVLDLLPRYQIDSSILRRLDALEAKQQETP